MTVGELIQELQRWHPNMQILMACDEEGNRINHLNEVSYQLAINESGEIFIYDTDEKNIEDSHRVLVLWPNG